MFWSLFIFREHSIREPQPQLTQEKNRERFWKKMQVNGPEGKKGDDERDASKLEKNVLRICRAGFSSLRFCYPVFKFHLFCVPDKY